jgi:hypothetical protein
MPRLENKVRTMKVAREKFSLNYKDKNIRIKQDFSSNTLKASKTLNNIFQALRVKNCQLRILYSPKLPLKSVEKLGIVAHACNPSYSRGRDQAVLSSSL